MAKVKNTEVPVVEGAVTPAVEVVVQQVAEKAGRALIDLPAHGLLSGEYGAIPSETADALSAIGAFDTNAVEVKE